MQSGDGQSQSTIERTVGDQSYSITTNKYPDKDDETLENYVNMDEGKHSIATNEYSLIIICI